jgi:RNA polymerase sigma factor (TIGR02999 family)
VLYCHLASFGFNRTSDERGQELSSDTKVFCDLEVQQPPQMISESNHEITALLQAWNGGDQDALERLTPLIYKELHRAARQCMARERGADPLQTTALINELYVKMVDLKRVSWQNRAHFFALCARQMRRILTDYYRAGSRQKRGGRQATIAIDASTICVSEPPRDLMAIDEALERLAQIDTRKSQVVELRFFGGLSVKDTADVLQVSPETVMRDWKFSKAWLLNELKA